MTRLPVDVVWGDVTRVDADVYVAGHYIGVIPQNAELALDRVVSGIPRGAKAARADLVITQQSLRGMLRGALGEISLFPGDTRPIGASSSRSPGWATPARTASRRSAG